MKAPLRDLAVVRASSVPGGIALAVVASGAGDYAILARELTVTRVRAALGPGAPPPAGRHELPRLGCLIFPLLQSVNDTAWALRLDGGRLEWAGRLLELEIDEEPHYP